MKIFKYQLENAARQMVPMPAGAQILSIQTQDNVVCIWAMVESDQPLFSLWIDLIPTGLEFIPANRKYLATVQQGPFVWHIFQYISK